MRYIATKLEDDNYEVTHFNFMEQEDGNKVEVIMGKTKPNRVKLEEAIEKAKEEMVLRINEMEKNIKDLEEILEAINNCK